MLELTQTVEQQNERATARFNGLERERGITIKGIR